MGLFPSVVMALGFYSPGMGLGLLMPKILFNFNTNFCWPEPSEEFYTPIMISGGSVLVSVPAHLSSRRSLTVSDLRLDRWAGTETSSVLL